MKILQKIGLIVLLLTGLSTSAQEKYTVNSETSELEWIGEKVTGSHNGTIQVEKGYVLVQNGMIVSSELIIDMNTIKITDIKSENSNEKLKSHLNSPDFFGVKKYPTSTLKILKVKKDSDNKYLIYAELTIKDITEKVEIPATIIMKEDKLVAIGETKIDRTKFDIRYGSGSFFDNLGDKAIEDLFTIKFKVGAVK